MNTENNKEWSIKLMDAKTIETLSVSAVRDSIVITGLLDQQISDNDKEPSWDGFVYIYKSPKRSKEDYKGRVAVQVKGKQFEDLTQENISYPVNVNDLNNYLHDGGAIFFVVYISEKSFETQIYYCELTPIQIQNIRNRSRGKKNKYNNFKKVPYKYR